MRTEVETTIPKVLTPESSGSLCIVFWYYINYTLGNDSVYMILTPDTTDSDIQDYMKRVDETIKHIVAIKYPNYEPLNVDYMCQAIRDVFYDLG